MWGKGYARIAMVVISVIGFSSFGISQGARPVPTPTASRNATQPKTAA